MRLSDYQRNHRPLLGECVSGYAQNVGVAMLDSTICDIYLVDEVGNLLGRPILTACVDAYSQMCCGFALTWQGGVSSLRELMQNVITDKAVLCKKNGVMALHNRKLQLVCCPLCLCSPVQTHPPSVDILDIIVRFKCYYIFYSFIIAYRVQQTRNKSIVIQVNFEKKSNKLYADTLNFYVKYDNKGTVIIVIALLHMNKYKKEFFYQPFGKSFLY